MADSNGTFKAIDAIRRRTRFDGAQRDLALYMEARISGGGSERNDEVK